MLLRPEKIITVEKKNYSYTGKLIIIDRFLGA